jgi:hypothetical protein
MNRLHRTFRLILAELNTPSAQRDQWFLWCAAQMAHALLGAAALAAGIGLWLGVSARLKPPI